MKNNTSNQKRTTIFLFLMFFSLFLSVSFINANSNVVDLGSAVKNFFIEATKGTISGTETLNKFGHNTAVGATEEDVWETGGTLQFLEGAELITISSSSGSDTIAGVGARTITIQGLDANFNFIEEDVNLSGVTPVNTTNSYIRVWRSFVKDVGQYGATNVGDITYSASINGSTQLTLGAGEGQSQTTHYTVPAGKEVIITGISIKIQTGKTVDVNFKVRRDANDTVAPYRAIRVQRSFVGLVSPVQTLNQANYKFGEKTDIWFTALTSTGTTSEVEISYDLVQYDK